MARGGSSGSLFADGGAKTPQHTDDVQPGVPDQVEDEGQADQGGRGAGHGQPARPLAVAQPEPADDQHDAHVFEQQRDPDRQVLNGVEVTHLATRDRQQTVEGDHPHIPPHDVPPAAKQHDGGNRQDQRRDADPDRDRGSRRPTGPDQRTGEGAGGAEGRGRQQGEDKSGSG
jgi:hypothetical protein